jgi:hypothetical protein
MSVGIVYVLVNPAFDSYVKVGKTIDLQQRLKQLDNTSVPLPFRCVYAIQVEDYDSVERLVHQAFADVRVRSSREFFEVDAQRVISALKLTRGVEVTPKDDVAEDDEGLRAMERRIATKRSFKEADVNVGDIVCYAKDESITAEVISDRKIAFEGEQMSLSKAALILLHRDGYTWQQANGWAFWTKDGETLAERAKQREQSDEEDSD